MPPHLRPHIRCLQGQLREAFGERLRDVRLFGSYARGEATEDSDVDVLVLVDDLAPSEAAKVSDIATRVTLETGVTLAPLPLSSARFADLVASGRTLAAEIVRDGATV